ncbi:MAG: polysaccharide biosynthesis/export family protein [Planctomycetes bacterium]|nr:polysaccharide biosynthesis/export family protein [Planctomycetota bacterium]
MEHKRFSTLVSVSLLILLGLATGCTRLALSIKGNAPKWSKDQAGKQKTEMQERKTRLSQQLAAWKQRYEGESGPYRLGPEDELEVTIFGMEKPGQPALINCAVRDNGTINLPWAGEVSVGGLTVEQAEKQIAGVYDGEYLNDPQVSLRVTKRLSSTVFVLGAVKTPGFYPLKERSSTLLSVLSAAGGIADNASSVVTVVAPGDATKSGQQKDSDRQVTVDLKSLLEEGDLSGNVKVGPGYIVSVPPTSIGYYVLGYVRRPGRYELRRQSRISALQAVANAGGLSADGRPKNAYIVRHMQGVEKVIPLNLTKVASGKLPEPYLEAGDGLVMGTDWLAQLGHFIRGGASLSASASVSP